MHTPAVITICKAFNTPFDVTTLTGLPGRTCSTLWCSNKVPPFLTNNSYVYMSKESATSHSYVTIGAVSHNVISHIRICTIVIGPDWPTVDLYYQQSDFVCTISWLQCSNRNKGIHFYRTPSILMHLGKKHYEFRKW